MAIQERVITKLQKDGALFMKFSSEDRYKIFASFHPDTGDTRIQVLEAQNLTLALKVVLDRLQTEAKLRGHNPLIPLLIEIDPGKFTEELQRIAPKFGFGDLEYGGEFGTDQILIARAELPLAV